MHIFLYFFFFWYLVWQPTVSSYYVRLSQFSSPNQMVFAVQAIHTWSIFNRYEWITNSQQHKFSTKPESQMQTVSSGYCCCFLVCLFRCCASLWTTNVHVSCPMECRRWSHSINFSYSTYQFPTEKKNARKQAVLELFGENEINRWWWVWKNTLWLVKWCGVYLCDVVRHWLFFNLEQLLNSKISVNCKIANAIDLTTGLRCIFWSSLDSICVTLIYFFHFFFFRLWLLFVHHPSQHSVRWATENKTNKQMKVHFDLFVPFCCCFNLIPFEEALTQNQHHGY